MKTTTRLASSVLQTRLGRLQCVFAVCVLAFTLKAHAYQCTIFNSLPSERMSLLGIDVDDSKRVLTLPLHSPQLQAAQVLNIGDYRSIRGQLKEPKAGRESDPADHNIVIEFDVFAKDPHFNRNTAIQMNVATGEFRMDSYSHGEDITTSGHYTYESLLAGIMNSLPPHLPHDRQWTFENHRGHQRLLLSKPIAGAPVTTYPLYLPKGVEAHLVGDRFLILRGTQEHGFQVGDHRSSAILLNLEEFLFDRYRFQGHYNVDIAEVTPVYQGNTPSEYKILEVSSISVTDPQVAIDSKLQL